MNISASQGNEVTNTRRALKKVKAKERENDLRPQTISFAERIMGGLLTVLSYNLRYEPLGHTGSKECNNLAGYLPSEALSST